VPPHVLATRGDLLVDPCHHLFLVRPFLWSQEGFVAVDAQFRRAKIKSPAYVWLAHAGSNPQRDIRNIFFKVLLQVRRTARGQLQ
jgi:hypothetical protein